MGIKYLIKSCKEELDKRNLKRIGYCCKCGECCKYAGGMSFDCCNIKSFWVNKSKNEVCKSYDKKTKSCKHHKYKRWICKCWPMLPEHIEKFPKCTYKFVKKC